ncbi:MAG: cell surface protein SprA, partial [Bacteroidota bacterium]
MGAFPNALQNEQSLAIRTCNLNPNDARGIYKLLGLDLRQYKRIKMFVHAEPQDPQEQIPVGDMSVFIRLGRDFETDFYEYEIPLTMSEPIEGTDMATEIVTKVWPEINAFDFPLELFRDVKLERNAAATPLNQIYEIIDPEKPDNRVKVLGNPDLGFAKTIMIGVRNNSATGVPHCTEVWVNELRLNGLDEAGGTAGLARLDVQMADFGNATLSGAFTSIGWGALDQQVDQRSQERIMQYDFATNLELGKFFPKNSGIRIPFYAQYSTTVKTPEFDPYQFDITLADNLANQTDDAARDSIRQQAEDFTSIRGFNFTNVRKERTTQRQVAFPWDISNFSFTYAYTHTLKRDPTIERNSVKQYRGAIDYNYSPGLKPIEPFKKLIKSRSKWLALIKDFNLNPVPNSLSFRTEMNRHFGVITYRFSDPENNTFYDKRFFWDRIYGLQWNITRNLNFSFNATNNSVIDENDGPITDAERDFIWENLRNFGRTKNYNQNVSLAYNLPTRKIPFLDWTQVRASYTGNYTWSAASLNVDSLGNVIQNGSTRQLNGDLDFTKLYNKSKYLKKINSPARNNSRNSSRGRDGGKNDKEEGGGKGRKEGGKGNAGIDGKDGGKENKKNKKGKNEGDPASEGGKADKSKDKKAKKDREPSTLERVLIRPLMMVRKARVTYSENLSSVLPGFTPTPRFFGLSDGFSAPGWGYGLGLSQPDSDFLNDAAANGWITNNIFLNQQVLASRSENYEIRLTIEPFKDFR